jgi:hypothetical protein
MKDRLQLLMDAFFSICATLMVTSFAPVDDALVEEVQQCNGPDALPDCYTLAHWCRSHITDGITVCFTFCAVTRAWFMYIKSSAVGTYGAGTLVTTVYVCAMARRFVCWCVYAVAWACVAMSVGAAIVLRCMLCRGLRR